MKDISYVIIACYPDKGMKSYGSKGLMVFNNKRLLDYQIDLINKSQNIKNNYEIIILCDFDIQKIYKNYNKKIRVEFLNKQNPIHKAAQIAKYNNILFIDYGCLFHISVIKNINTDNSNIICVKDHKISKLDIGCIIDKNKTLQHMFFDLPDNKFCNMFLISGRDRNKILSNNIYHRYNLLYFEILNQLKNDGSIIDVNYIQNNKFIYFNNMRQKNGISKFIKNM